ncbi:MAG: hypothetical protein ACR2PJ_07825 [Pseudomonadales bacterium]
MKLACLLTTSCFLACLAACGQQGALRLPDNPSGSYSGGEAAATAQSPPPETQASQ